MRITQDTLARAKAAVAIANMGAQFDTRIDRSEADLIRAMAQTTIVLVNELERCYAVMGPEPENN
jgi:hypothetical protein